MHGLNPIITERRWATHQRRNEHGLMIDQPWHVDVFEVASDLIRFQCHFLKCHHDPADGFEPAVFLVNRLTHTKTPKNRATTLRSNIKSRVFLTFMRFATGPDGWNRLVIHHWHKDFRTKGARSDRRHME